MFTLSSRLAQLLNHNGGGFHNDQIYPPFFIQNKNLNPQMQQIGYKSSTSSRKTKICLFIGLAILGNKLETKIIQKLILVQTFEVKKE